MPALRIATNQPVECRLTSIDGEIAPSSFGADQFRYRTDKGDLYVSPAVAKIFAAAIAAQGIKAGEPIVIAKLEASLGNGRKSIRWSMDRAGTSHGARRERSDTMPIGEQPDGTFAIPKPPAQAIAPASAPRPQWANVLLAQTNVLADVLAQAVQRSGELYGTAIKPEAIQSLMVTAFINLAKSSAVERDYRAS